MRQRCSRYRNENKIIKEIEKLKKDRIIILVLQNKNP